MAGLDLAQMGRELARKQGYDPARFEADYAAFGQLALSSPRPPDFLRFLQAARARERMVAQLSKPAVPSRQSAPPRGVASSGAAPSRRVRIGGFEVAFVGEREARNRPQRHQHRGERVGGRYRKVGAGYHRHPSHPYRHPVTRRHRKVGHRRR
jgi:hypothetical protein